MIRRPAEFVGTETAYIALPKGVARQDPAVALRTHASRVMLFHIVHVSTAVHVQLKAATVEILLPAPTRMRLRVPVCDVYPACTPATGDILRRCFASVNRRADKVQIGVCLHQKGAYCCTLKN